MVSIMMHDGPMLRETRLPTSLPHQLARSSIAGNEINYVSYICKYYFENRVSYMFRLPKPT